VKIDNQRFLDAIIYCAKNGCSWRALPPVFGDWHVIYVRKNRWAKNGVLECVYAALVSEGQRKVRLLVLDSTAVKAPPDAHGAEKKTADRR